MHPLRLIAVEYVSPQIVRLAYYDPSAGLRVRDATLPTRRAVPRQWAERDSRPYAPEDFEDLTEALELAAATAGVYETFLNSEN